LKAIIKFAVHASAAMLGSLLSGFLLVQLLHPSGTKNLWFDAPYGPPLWGSALVLGFCLNLAMNDKSAQWVWPVGILWLALWCASTVAGYNPQWCSGCSLSQWLWYRYFSYWNCTGECLGQLFGTAPMFNCMSYSVGAAAGLRLRKHIPSIVSKLTR
jgi:hypothetical protein